MDTIIRITHSVFSEDFSHTDGVRTMKYANQGASTLLPMENFQPAFRRSTLASAVVGGAIAMGSAAYAQNSTPQGGVTTLVPVQVQGQAPYQASEASSVRMTAPLRDTPRTITVVPEQLIQDRGVSTLADVLRTTPGITLGAGEGGTPTGDRPFVRGYESSTDITIDGVRDFARGYHETFNLESVEIVKGPSSAYGGRGGTGGSINLQTKTPKNFNFAEIHVGAGNADQWTTTLDGNVVVQDNIAMRLNVMKMGGKTPGRDFVKIDRFGVAPSVTFGLDTPTRATVSYSLVRNEDTPDQGFPFSSAAHPEVHRPVGGVDRDLFYGRRHVDFRESWAKQSTLLLEHDFANGWQVRNTTRHSDTLNHYFMGRPTFAHCDPDDFPARAGLPMCDPNSPAATYRSGTRLRWRGSEALINQTDLLGELQTGSVKHRFNFGMEFGKDVITERPMSVTGITDDDDNVWYPLHNPQSGLRYLYAISYGPERINAEIRTRSIYLFDTMELNEQWQINVGLRHEQYRVKSHSYAPFHPARNPLSLYARKDHLFNYQLGVVYKPAHNGSIYASYATSSNPAGENVGQGGGADGVAGSGQFNNNTYRLKPEKSRSIELGTKWDVFNERLSLTAAIFETKKTDARSTDPTTGLTTLDGNNRVRGVELGASGAITPQWDVWAGYTYLDPKLSKYRSGATDYSGRRMKFIPKQSASVWTTYKVIPALTLGGGVTYMGMRYANDQNTYELPSYRRYDLMAKYEINKNFSVQLNANNITDTELYDSSHVGLFYNVGPGRSYMLTARYRYE